MTTIEALQNLYEALGGEPSAVENINTIPAMLSEISEQLSGGSGLPDVTAEDDGKVLSVVDGEWAKATLDKNYNKIYRATISSSTVTLLDNVKPREILNEFRNGKNVKVYIDGEFYSLTKHTSEYVTFSLVTYSQQKLRYKELFINNTLSSGTYTEHTFTPDA